VVTTNPRVVPPPPRSSDQRLLSSRWNSNVGVGIAVSSARHRHVGALVEASSFAPTTLFDLGAINRGGALAWASC
jgi:hypothetical protein